MSTVVVKGSTEFAFFSIAVAITIASAHFAYPRWDDQAELAWMAYLNTAMVPNIVTTKPNHYCQWMCFFHVSCADFAATIPLIMGLVAAAIVICAIVFVLCAVWYLKKR